MYNITYTVYTGMPVAAVSLHPDALIRKSMSQCHDDIGAGTIQSRNPLIISEFGTFISENGACPRVAGADSRRKTGPHREVRRLAEGTLLPASP